MRFEPCPLTPAPRPRLDQALVIGDVRIARTVSVYVKGVVFNFWRKDDATWTGGAAETGERGVAIDEPWLKAAREVAVEALKREFHEAGEGEEAPTETVRCAECARLLCSPKLVDVDVHTMACGPEHVLTLADGRRLVVPASGEAMWADAPAVEGEVSDVPR